MGPGGLNFRVRDGNGCGPSGKIAGKLLRTVAGCRFPVVRHFGGRKSLLQLTTDHWLLATVVLNSAASKTAGLKIEPCTT